MTTHAETGIGEKSIRIGMVNVQSGPASGLGKGMLTGAKSVFDEINANGGIHGRKIDLVVADDGYEPDRTVDQTLAMIEKEKIFALFGYVGTPTANSALPIVKEMKVPLVGLFTGAMTLRAPVSKEVFNIRASYDDEAEQIVDHFVGKGAKNIAVFYQDDGFGKAVLSGTEKALKKRSMAVSAKGTFQRNTLAIKSGLATMVDSKPDAIVMVGPYAPLAEFVKQARAAGLTSELATVSFVGTENLVAAVGKQGDGVLISQVVPFPQDTTVAINQRCAELVKRHSKEVIGYVNLEGCISAHVLVRALEKAGPAPTRDLLISTLESMQNEDLGGLKLGFSATNHQAFSKVFLTQIRDGQINKLQ